MNAEERHKILQDSVKELASLRARVAVLEKERDVYKEFINGYGSFPCHPDCDTFSHSDQCPRVDIPLAFRNLQSRLALLEKVAEAAKEEQKRHLRNWYPDYTSTANGFKPRTPRCDCPLCAALDAAKEG